MNIPYLYQLQATDSIDVEDLGNFYFQAFNDDGQEYCLGVSTHLGWSTVEEFGPMTCDMDTLPNYFNYRYSRSEYDQKKLFKLVDKFLNDDKKGITQVFFIDYDTFSERLKNLKKQ